MDSAPIYRELPPPARLADDVQCLWVAEAETALPAYQVLPDGCTDIIVQPAGGGGLRVELVGAMSRPQQVSLLPGRRVLGLRFRPGMAYRYLPLPAAEVADRSVPMADISAGWSRGLAALAGELLEMPQADAALELLASRLGARQPGGPVQRLCTALEQSHGAIRVDDLAASANLSPRQMRRLFLQQVGLGPKQLARILRFQYALALSRESHRPDWAGVAVDSGYSDQAHLSHEFSALAGCSPAQLLARR